MGGTASKTGAKFALAFATLTAANPNWKEFEAFKTKFNLTFETEEENATRFKIFESNMARAAALNDKSKGKARFGVTKFSHLTKEEFKKHHTGFKPKADRVRPPKKTVFTAKHSGSIDWRTKGAISPVKDQGQCGSCWAFSATEAVETGYYLHTGRMKILSPQQTVSCDDSDLGCNGGDTITAYEYMREAGGIELEADYPYKSGVTERTGTCKADPSDYKVKVGQSQTISDGASGESDMYREIQESPMSICVDAESWQMYMGGVVDSSTCGTELDHCVHLVGMKAGDYWIVKNSWAASWGEEGYIRVKTGENACGVAMEATIADASDETAGIKIDQRVIDVIQGLSEGFGLKMEEQCVNDSVTMIDDLEKAEKLIEKKTPIAMAEAMRLIATALETEWPAAAKSCEATKQEIDDLVASLEILKHPKQFVYHVAHDLAVNGVDIYSNTNDAVGHWKKSEYHDFGVSTGKALNLLIIGADPSAIFV